MNIYLHNLFPLLHMNTKQFSAINERLAAKLLSATVSKVLSNYRLPDPTGTSNFVE